jgi:O-antigen ligase
MISGRVRSNLVEWGVLGSAVLGFTITEEYCWYITAGLFLLAVATVLRCLRTHRLIQRSGLELPILLFLCSAGVATWIAVDLGTALLQFARMLGAVVIYYAVIQSEPQLRSWLAVSFILMALALAIYWPLQHDFSPDQAKFQVVAQVGVWLNQHFPAIPGPAIHANVAAGSLAPGLPFVLALAIWAGQRKIWLAILGLVIGLIIAVSLLLTSSRGAWLGCGVTLLMALLVIVVRKGFMARISPWLFWMAILFVGLTGLAITTGSHILGGFGVTIDPTGTVQSRSSLWQQGLLLMGDTPFTGIGLMGFRLVYAIYGLLIHVPHHNHLHNSYLEVGLEQGILGLLALLWGLGVVCFWSWRGIERKGDSLWGWAGLAALCIMAVHGIVDVVFYVERTLPLVGLFTGMAYLVSGTSTGVDTVLRVGPRKIGRWRVAITALFICLGLTAVFFRQIVGAWYANLGVVEQQRLELSTYDASHFDNPTLDEVRQQLDLDQAVAYFEQAIGWNPQNRTAQQRLAEITLSRGDYPQALELMQTAWDAGQRDEITRLLLGDALAAQGFPHEAAETVQSLPWAVMRLNGQAWYRYYQQADYERAAFAWQAVLALDPNDSGAQQGLDLLNK